MKKTNIDKITFDTANEFSIKMIFAISKKYKISLEKAINVLEDINYYKVINNDEL